MKYIILFLSVLLFVSCEEVIDVELNESEPKLVVQATMIRLLDNAGGGTEVKLNLTGPFFDNETPAVTDAIVTITDNNGAVFSLTHFQEGVYRTDINLVPQDNTDYTLTIIYDGDTYSATEQINSVVPWEEEIEQDNEGGFLGDEIEVKAFFTDPADEENYYYAQTFSEKGDDLDVTSDEFFNGNQIFVLFSKEDLEPGDEVIFELDGVDRNFTNFMFVLLQQGSEDSGGPFETQPATVRGNLVNETNPDNFPLGYFRVSERATLTYIIQ